MDKKIVLTVLSLAFLLAVYLFATSDYMKVDRCLDSGGKWDDAKQVCVAK